MPDPLPIVFICYARADNKSSDPDERWLDRMRGHLKPYEGVAFKVFWDERVPLGGRLHPCIQENLRKARVTIQLVSVEFMASDYLRDHEPSEPSVV